MERKVLEMVLEAKRIFTYDKEKTTPQLVQEYNITYHEVWFWFQVMYKDQLDSCREGINRLFLPQVATPTL
jgi:hypothetical protein